MPTPGTANSNAQIATVAFSRATRTINGGTGTTVDVVVTTSDGLDLEAAVTGDVVLSEPNDEVDSYTPTSFSFGAGTSSGETETISITSNSNAGTATFSFDNLSGAVAATPSTFDLTVALPSGLNAGDLVITEFMADPAAVADTQGEYVEVYNTTDDTIDLNGLELADGGSDSHLISGSVPVPSEGFAVLCINSVSSSNGGVPCDYQYSGFTLGQSGDEILLRDGGFTVARATYGTGSPYGAGRAFELRALSLVDANGTVRRNTQTGTSSGGRRPYVTASLQLSGGDFGSPGAAGNTALNADEMTLGNLGGTGNVEDIGWYLLSVPATGVTLADLAAQNGVQGVEGFSPDAAANLYTSYDQGTTDPDAVDDFFEPTGGGTYSFVPGNGFIWYHFDNDLAGSTPLPYTLSATGSEPSAPVTFTIPDSEFYLAGNPWQNSLVLSDITQSGGSGSLGDNVQVYDPFDDSYRAALSRTGSPDTVGVWQGFFLEETGGIDPVTVEIVDSGVNGGNFVGRQALAERRLGFVLRGRNDDLGVTTYDEAALLRFNALATADNDAFDGSKLNPLTGVYGTIAFVGEREGEAHLRAVESRPYDAEGFAVEMDVQTSIAGTFTLTWPLQEDLPEAWPLELEDRVTGEVIDLRASESYTFEASPEAAPRVTAETLAEARRALPATLRAEPSWLQAETRSTGPRFVLRVGATGVAAEGDDLPGGYRLSAVYPNPFNPQAQFALTLSEAQAVRAEVFDALGRRVAVLADGVQAAGSETYRLDGRALASGVYVIRVAGERFVETRRVTLVK